MTSFFDSESQVAPLVRCDENGLSVDEETLSWLSQHKGKIGAIACAGKYRTGKSFLLNRLVSAESCTGFGVGETVQACTKGLWVHKRLFDGGGSCKVLVIDTEGIDALDANDTNDVKIFTLALLLSSIFLYNSVGPIDETAMQTLSLMTRVTENLRQEANEESDFVSQMPRFFWVLRDFSLRLTNRDGQAITPNEYLEEALTPPSIDKGKNGVRDAIRSAFPKRELITLPRPSTDDANTQTLEHKLFSVSKRFASLVDDLRSKLWTEIVPLSANGTLVTGPMYAELVRHLTTTVQSGVVPVMRDSWTLMASVQARDLRDEMVSTASETLREWPVKGEETFGREVEQYAAGVLSSFLSKAMRPIDEECVSSLESRLRDLVLEAKTRSSKALLGIMDGSLDELDALLSQSPDDLSSIIQKAQDSFAREHAASQDLVKHWRLMASERALCKWIPNALASLSSERDSLSVSLSEMREEREKEKEGDEERREQREREVRLEREEMEMRLSSQASMLDQGHVNVQSLLLEVMHLELGFAVSRSEAKQREETDLSSSEMEAALLATKEEVDEARLSYEKVCSDLALLQKEVSQEREGKERAESLLSEREETLKSARATHEALERAWKEGIEDLQAEKAAAVEEMRIDFETRSETLRAREGDALTQLEKEKAKVADGERRGASLEQKLDHITSSSEREIVQLKEVCSQHRTACEAAQKRVMEMHQGMLDDLRMRDERARETQTRTTREQHELQAKNGQLIRENELCKHEIEERKKRIAELEAGDRELKRMKNSLLEKDLLTAKMTTELDHLRVKTAEIGAERTSLRQQNLAMEGELAVLRQEKNMWSAKKAIGNDNRLT